MNDKPMRFPLRRVGLFSVISALCMLIVLPKAASGHPTATTKRADDKLETFTETLPGTVVKIQMIAVPGGTIKIGDKTVTVKPYWLAQTETPWEAFDAFTQSGPPSKPYDQTKFPIDAIARPSKSYILPDRGWGHHGYPAINLSFDSVTMFCRWLSSVTKKKYRLPTEAEWELACREGVDAPVKLSKGQIEKASWYAGNSATVTHPVATKAANKLGFFDMLGNVGEWTVDLEGKPVLCGNTFQDEANAINPSIRRHFEPKWQETDPQMPKSRWWLSDSPFAGFRIVCEP